MRELARCQPDGQIARLLNRLGYRRTVGHPGVSPVSATPYPGGCYWTGVDIPGFLTHEWKSPLFYSGNGLSLVTLDGLPGGNFASIRALKVTHPSFLPVSF